MANTSLPNYIVSIDDIGLYPMLDEKILTHLQSSGIDRVSIIVGLYDLSKVSAQLSTIPVAKDIHLNSTIKKLYVPSEGIGITGNIRRIIFLLSLYLNPNTVLKIEKDWDTQIQTFKDTFGSYPDGINSHEHIHLLPRLFPIALRLANTYSIPYIRMGRETVIVSDFRARLLCHWHQTNTTSLSATEVKTSTALYSYDWKRLSKSEILQEIPQGSELIFHAQYIGDDAFLKNISSTYTGNLESI